VVSHHHPVSPPTPGPGMGISGRRLVILAPSRGWVTSCPALPEAETKASTAVAPSSVPSWKSESGRLWLLLAAQEFTSSQAVWPSAAGRSSAPLNSAMPHSLGRLAPRQPCFGRDRGAQTDPKGAAAGTRLDRALFQVVNGPPIAPRNNPLVDPSQRAVASRYEGERRSTPPRSKEGPAPTPSGVGLATLSAIQ
jgi:hypothetical protein